jgi:hypothetical protein
MFTQRYKYYEIQIDSDDWNGDLGLFTYRILDYNDIVIKYGHYSSEDIPKHLHEINDAINYIANNCQCDINKYSANVDKLDLSKIHTSINNNVMALKACTDALIIHHNKEGYTLGDVYAQAIVDDIKYKLNGFMYDLDLIIREHTIIEVNSYND